MRWRTEPDLKACSDRSSYGRDSADFCTVATSDSLTEAQRGRGRKERGSLNIGMEKDVSALLDPPRDGFAVANMTRQPV